MIVAAVTTAYKNISFSGSEVKRIAEFVCAKEKIKNAGRQKF